MSDNCEQQCQSHPIKDVERLCCSTSFIIQGEFYENTEKNNKKKKPNVSIIIPIYNVEKEIERMLNSICKQTFTDYEVIMIDDGSNVHRERASQPVETERAAGCAELYARPESGSDNEPPRGG